MTVSNAQGVFRGSGVFPFNPSAIPDHAYAPSATTERSVMPSTTTEEICGAILSLPEAAAGGSVTVNGGTTSVAVETVPLLTSDTVVTDHSVAR